MSDICDRAETLEQQHRDRAIEVARARSMETPLTDGHGKRICIDCEEVISAARLEAVPHAVRCCSCQVDAEYRSGGR